ncbi:L-seryl-tRNA(Sec) selenium transferase [Alkaliphilus metalliredigens QYMF]|uniref:L-seryl-tRNA(Sec) selenium transferase n=1 Tax=Alkaliphilus metalliredigens (strain QYMF) TaxID=293826 RepID=SELA_ALKMQ|nr:L-seryl-tRNA(Sec) selenium transferase [Alkaliphilus metalliredigens]A6TQL2.1 RecName: Full=L-seryl-tRNA(Sec) selenium transferase; AltName: Full=Selenocysteine synthase; Short=Sec synthase; AltName: Full=Selenocysteinyl-tRNA(Sec) synthase [Alkaliphilus metalliredigens QYMF]ABR48480.1 L-seryl-tRNA(Sec) selenium transferase [Alkaliphilus metalliredigens QYMF]
MNKGRILSQLPSVDELIKNLEHDKLEKMIPRSVVVEQTRITVDTYRKAILTMDEGSLRDYQIDITSMHDEIKQACESFCSMNLREVINGTGVILHTNLGRSLLSEEIKGQIWEVASGYSTLEIDVTTGKRGSRYNHVVDVLKHLTGAEDALVVNNNAAAVMLVLGTIAKGKEVIVSRGELVEIGGSFRVPDVMEQSGGKLREVGTTNKTHLWDYEGAISDETAALLKVHTSNYRIMGFTESVGLEEIVELGNRYHIPTIEDIGSGVLIDLQKYGLAHEPTVQESVKAGVDIVTFSGDKLLGGPQAGIIVGKRKWIEKMKKNPLTRAIRVDKLTMAALEATLKLYLDEDTAIKHIPTLKMLTENLDTISERASDLFRKLQALDEHLLVRIEEDFSQVGGGSMPLEKLPTKVITLEHTILSAAQMETKLRNFKRPIFTRIRDEKVMMDLRTIREKDFVFIVEALKTVAK